MESLKGKHEVDLNDMKNRARMHRSSNKQVTFLSHLANKGKLLDISKNLNSEGVKNSDLAEKAADGN